ncbi:MAG: hemolysin III family protein [Bacteroidota bacterium]
MRILDHSAIFILIAGTYTPVCLVSLWDSWGQLLLIVIWTIALLGIIAKIFLTGKYDRASTILYVAMGWIAIAIVKPLFDSLSSDALLWLLYGGICYTLGAVLYSFQKIKFNHSIFHLFVLGGSYCHFVMVHNHII